MDGNEIRQRITEILQKYRYAALVLVAGVFLMLIPFGTHEKSEDTEPLQSIQVAEEESFERKLSRTLSMIDGAGKVEVFLSLAAGEKTVYQTDEDIAAGNVRRETVLITDGTRTQSGLVMQVDPPVYQGAIVLCQGAENAEIRLSITQAVANATGLGTNQISVLKMK